MRRGIKNILEALAGRLAYFDRKRNKTVGINPSSTVIFTRPRGLHLHQAGVLPGELLPASLFDVAMVAYQVDFSALKHPLCIYIPKSESADEALWWRDLFQMMRGSRACRRIRSSVWRWWSRNPLAYQMEEFAWNLRNHIVGLNLGRWDYMASLIHFNLENPEWVLPDRNTRFRTMSLSSKICATCCRTICHKHGMLAIGGMTALFPSREDAELNARALKVLAEDKKNESNSLMDGSVDGTSRSKRNCGEPVPCSESTSGATRKCQHASRPAASPRWSRQTHAGGNARRGAHRYSLSQWRSERQGRESPRWLYGGPRYRSHLPVDDRAADEAL